MCIFCSNVKYEFLKTVYLYKTDAALATTKSLVYIQWLLSYIKEFHELGIHFLWNSSEFYYMKINYFLVDWNK